MTLSFGNVTRGTGKVYQEIFAEVPDGCSLRAESRVGRGAEVPCNVLSVNRRVHRYVVVVPALLLAQTVSVRVLDGSGSVVESAERKISHSVAALTSKFNTFKKTEGIEDIRNFDLRGCPEEAHVECTHFIPETDDTRTLIMTVEVLLDDACDPQAPLSISILSRMGEAIPSTRFTVLHDSADECADSKECSVRKIQCSCRIKGNTPAFIVWARFEDGSTPDGFVVLLPDMADALRGNTDAWLFGNSSIGGKYDEWFRSEHRTSRTEIEMQRNVHHTIEPTFSIVVPLYKTPLDYFYEMADSVLDQSYPKFELLLVNATPEDAELCAAAEELAHQDSRVKVITLDGNHGITLNTNEGIKAASGDFLCFFDHDDVLEPDILFEYVKGINAYPDTDLLYCDEDKLIGSKFADCNMKPDFDWDLLYACNYVCHLLTVRKSIIDSFEGLPGKEFDGSQDHNMTLRVAEHARNIYHARKVLYHWRVHAGSTAAGAQEKPWTQESGKIAIQQHFDRLGIAATVTDDPKVGNYYCVDWPMPEEKPLVSIIIPNKDCAEYLERCVSSIFEKSTYDRFEIVIVENNSTTEQIFELYRSLEAEHGNLRVITFEDPFDFSAICNLGAAQSSGDVLLFLNNDTQVIAHDWLERMLVHINRDNIGCVGAKLLYPNDLIQHVGIVVPKWGPAHINELLPRDTLGYFGYLRFPKEASAITGACLMVSRANFELVGGFDTEFPIAYNDVDFCLRLRQKGLRVIVEPRAELYHYESVSRGADFDGGEKQVRLQGDLARLMSRYPKLFVEGDPFYNPNLELGSTHYQLAWKFSLQA